MAMAFFSAARAFRGGSADPVRQRRNRPRAQYDQIWSILIKQQQQNCHDLLVISRRRADAGGGRRYALEGMTDISLQKTAKTARRGERGPLPKRRSGNPARRLSGSKN
jgi:hypothetical protein